MRCPFCFSTFLISIPRFLRDEDIPNWRRYTQAEGQPYFVNASRELVFVTEADLYNYTVLDELEAFLNKFERHYDRFKARFCERVRSPGHPRNSPISDANANANAVNSDATNRCAAGDGIEREIEEYTVSTLPNHTEVVLQIDGGEWAYYMVDLDRRMVFWIDDTICDEVSLPPHFGVQLREHFRESPFNFFTYLHSPEGLVGACEGMINEDANWSR